MIYTDYAFLIGCLIGIGIYYLLPGKIRWIWLLVMSIGFFCTWGVELLPLVLVLVLVAWGGARIIDGRYGKAELLQEAEKKAALKVCRKGNKCILLACVILLIAVLLYVKIQKLLPQPFLSGIYAAIQELFHKIRFVTNFVSRGDGAKASGLDHVLFRIIGVPWGKSVLSESKPIVSTWIIPLGLSYYTLSLIGYVADVFWRKEKAETNFFKLLLFTLYFPKILEGPISKYRNVAPSLFAGNAFDYQKVCFGLQRVIWGLLKKMVIADRLIIVVNSVFDDHYMERFGSEFLIAGILGVIQLYCDFSGCMDIGLGFSECFGISLEENFNHPFASRSAAEFWRRWHITLGVWFKDYIYLPISASSGFIRVVVKVRKCLGKRAGKAFAVAIPLVVVWILTGLWHGTGWNYLVWGAYWGILIILGNVLEPELKGLSKMLQIDTECAGFRFWQQCKVFLLFLIGRLISMPSSLTVTGYAFSSVLKNFGPWKLFDGSLLKMGLNIHQFIVVVIAIALLGFVSSKQEQGIHIRQWIAKRPIAIRWVIYLAVIFTVIIFGAYGPGYDASSFVYMVY